MARQTMLHLEFHTPYTSGYQHSTITRIMQWKNETASEQFSNQDKSTWFRSHLPHRYIMVNTPADTHTQTHALHTFISTHRSTGAVL